MDILVATVLLFIIYKYIMLVVYCWNNDLYEELGGLIVLAGVIIYYTT